MHEQDATLWKQQKFKGIKILRFDFIFHKFQTLTSNIYYWSTSRRCASFLRTVLRNLSFGNLLFVLKELLNLKENLIIIRAQKSNCLSLSIMEIHPNEIWSEWDSNGRGLVVTVTKLSRKKPFNSWLCAYKSFTPQMPNVFLKGIKFCPYVWLVLNNGL